jgi:hypothetical protein
MLCRCDSVIYADEVRIQGFIGIPRDSLNGINTASSYPKRQHSSLLLPWKQQILQSRVIQRIYLN